MRRGVPELGRRRVDRRGLWGTNVRVRDLASARPRLRAVVRPQRRWRTLLLVVLALTLCLEQLRADGAAAPQPTLPVDIIRVSHDGWHFVDGRGNRFTPFGCTYADPATWAPEKRQERWDAGKTGPAVIEAFDPIRTDGHFKLLSETAQASVVRVFLSPAVFMPELGRFDSLAFKKLDRLIELAAQRNLRLILDVAEVWEGQARWMIGDGIVDFYGNDTAIHGISLFAAELGRRYRNNPTIFAWNLTNEPFVLGGDSPFMKARFRTWVRQKYSSAEELRAAWPDFPQPGESWPDNINPPDFAADLPGDGRLYDFQLFREYMATRWTARVARALRNEDPTHLITIGLIQFSSPIRDGKVWGWAYPGVNPHAIAPYVDFISMHAYVWNYEDRYDYIPGVLRYAFAGKPVVLEEFRYDDSVIDTTIGSTVGWLSWWCFDDPETKPHESLFDLQGNPTPEGLAFAKKAQELYARPSLMRVPAQVSLGVDRKLLLTSGAERDRYYAMYVSESKQRPVDFLIPARLPDPPFDMSVSVNAPARVTAGLPISYTITYTNPVMGPQVATGIVLTATLDTRLVSFQRANQGARFRAQDGTIEYQGESTRAGLSRSFQIEGIVSPDARPGEAVLLRARLSAVEMPVLPEVIGISIVVPPGVPTTRSPFDILSLLHPLVGRP